MEYKRIPGFGIYKISENGHIVCNIENEDQFEVETLKSKTSKGFYYVVSIFNNKLNKKFMSVHQLVCITFNGPPPSDDKVYDVNHKDGNKLNNHYSNLEWLSHSENTIHALKEGLRADNIPIEVHDHLEDKTTTYYSIIEMCRSMNLPRSVGYPIIGRYRENKFLSRYTFNVNISDFGRVNRKSKEVWIYDYVKDEWTHCGSINLASVITGIKSSTIKSVLRKPGRIVGSYYITNKEINNIKTMDKEKAIKFREHYYESAPLVSEDFKVTNIKLYEHS